MRGQGLYLAKEAATTLVDQEWARDQTVGLLSSDDPADIQAAAMTLSRLPREVTSEQDVNVLAANNHVVSVN